MEHEPKIEILSLADLSAVSCTFGKCPLPSFEFSDCLIVAFDGVAENSHEHIGTFSFMKAMIAAGIAAWSPLVVVLDLRKLKYSWGDEMGPILTAARCPRAVVVSSLNVEGLTSLVRDELFCDPKDWLFDSVAGAIARCNQLFIEQRDQDRLRNAESGKTIESPFPLLAPPRDTP